MEVVLPKYHKNMGVFKFEYDWIVSEVKGIMIQRSEIV